MAGLSGGVGFLCSFGVAFDRNPQLAVRGCHGNDIFSSLAGGCVGHPDDAIACAYKMIDHRSLDISLPVPRFAALRADLRWYSGRFRGRLKRSGAAPHFGWASADNVTNLSIHPASF